MNLWRVELLHLLRTWRGWTLSCFFLLASLLATLIGFLIQRSSTSSFTYDQTLDLYTAFAWLPILLWTGIAASSFAIDSNTERSVFLRLRFSLAEILISKSIFYFVSVGVLWLTGFAITFFLGLLIFDGSHQINLGWFLWGLFFFLITGIFSTTLILFCGALFRGAVASVLVVIGLNLGLPIIASLLILLELLIRGLTDTAPAEWETVSYVARTFLWWPSATYDAVIFMSVTPSEISADTSISLGQAFELEPDFRIKPLVSSVIAVPAMGLFGWRRYAKREV